ncbi:hypothetical protein B0H10DRAFT_2050248 [Mycena sp. CBHHK59/15]|nr:hypothetical protein B0H10DRAFT_2050248 [Mycena sp. CBHHK59/15]
MANRPQAWHPDFPGANCVERQVSMCSPAPASSSRRCVGAGPKYAPLHRDSGVDPRSGEHAAPATAPASGVGVVQRADVPALSLQPNARAPTHRSGQAARETSNSPWHPSSTARHPITSNPHVDLCWGLRLHPACGVLCRDKVSTCVGDEITEHTLAHRSRRLVPNEPGDLCPGAAPSHRCQHGPDSHWICMPTSDGDCAGVRGRGLALRKQLLPVQETSACIRELN